MFPFALRLWKKLFRSGSPVGNVEWVMALASGGCEAFGYLAKFEKLVKQVDGHIK